ncbi:hypothetical protein SKAU_G00094180 [Synaphobranchus kaupii]|uniref:Uncharacterized protein n=1 Tax=Synaphobranchus kaupii TaxID=118154 RepID=A0A9Q1J4M0_SYNKA|nr:hypothetical protein SKAU_G00094180 [Synaphobranchus kaupii]
MLRPILLKHRENIDNRQSRYEAAGEQWEQERPGKEMETDNQFGGAGDEQEREQGGAEWQKRHTAFPYACYCGSPRPNCTRHLPSVSPASPLLILLMSLPHVTLERRKSVA